jgi:hypothetical protein
MENTRASRNLFVAVNFVSSPAPAFFAGRVSARALNAAF